MNIGTNPGINERKRDQVGQSQADEGWAAIYKSAGSDDGVNVKIRSSLGTCILLTDKFVTAFNCVYCFYITFKWRVPNRFEAFL